MQLTDREIARAIGQFKAELGPLGPLTRRRGDAFAAAMATVAETEAAYARKVAEWERQAPKREAAQRAHQAAAARRGASVPVFASAAPLARPEMPRFW